MSENEIIEAEIVEEDSKEEKKENKEEKQDGFFKKMKNKINDKTYEYRMTSDFNKKHKKYYLYVGCDLLSPVYTMYAVENLDENYIIGICNTDDVKKDYLIENDQTKNVYYIDSVEKTKLEFEFEGKNNSLDAFKIHFKDSAKELNVIKVGNKYYEKR